MDIQTLTTFFMLCPIINGVLLVFWTTMCILAPDLVSHPQETFNVVIYSFFGLFKVVFPVFSNVPYAALLIVG